MKIAIVIVAILVIALGSATALATDYTFNATLGEWRIPDNWLPTAGAPPGVNDSATILNGQLCQIRNLEEPDNAQCDWFDVQKGGVLEIRKGSTLTILKTSPTSIVNGLLSISPRTTSGTNQLLIAADVTIEGTGEIRMGTQSVIDDNGTAYRLTLQNGTTTCAPYPVTCAVVVWGAGGDIKVTLTNNAYVIADFCGPEAGGVTPLTLSENAKNGHGLWMARESGILKVDIDVSGDGTWRTTDGTDPDCISPTIEINECLSVTGDVLHAYGSFKFNQNFCTVGDLTWKSEAISGGSDSTATIEVAANKAAKFGLAGCLPCQ